MPSAFNRGVEEEVVFVPAGCGKIACALKPRAIFHFGFPAHGIEKLPAVMYSQRYINLNEKSVSRNIESSSRGAFQRRDPIMEIDQRTNERKKCIRLAGAFLPFLLPGQRLMFRSPSSAARDYYSFASVCEMFLDTLPDNDIYIEMLEIMKRRNAEH